MIGPAASQRLKKVFGWLRWNFINTKIMLPDGRMVRKDHGIPSGSYFTSLVGSLSNAVICNYLMNIMGMEIKKQHYLGDDSLIFLHEKHFSSFNYDEARELAAVHLGMILHPDKFSVA